MNTYRLLINTYITNPNEEDELMNAIETHPNINRKSEWAIKWIEQGTFQQRLIAFAIVEGVFFSGSFCAIFWLKRQHPGKLVGLITSNEFISRDERMHCDTAVEVYRRIVNKLTQEEVHTIFREAVALESDFVTNALPVRLIGMNADLMIQYIQYVSDFWLRELGYEKLYHVANPFVFMEWQSLETKTNFFEARVSNYHIAPGKNGNVIKTDGDDF
jgi:ribonucleoside-diphosphate reductase beta chain